MTSKRTLFMAACALVLAGTCLYADTPLPSDPRIARGTLPNGCTWMYRQHDNPPGKMAMMMHVRSGSLNEVLPTETLIQLKRSS